MLTTYSMGILAGGTLVTVEIASIIAVTFFGTAFRKRFPRVAHHAAIGAKATSYRFFAGLDTFLVAWFVTGNPWTSTGIVGFEILTKFALFYTHEFVWSRPTFTKLMNLSARN